MVRPPRARGRSLRNIGLVATSPVWPLQLVPRPQDLVVLLRLALDSGPVPTDAALGAELGMTASEAHPCSAVPATASRPRRAVLPVVLPAALHPLPSARGSSRATSHHRRGRGRCVVARSSDVTRPPGITPMPQPADPSASLESSRKVSFSNTTSENDCSSAVRRWGSKI